MIGNYELSNYPPSLMQYRELHECKNKADLGKSLNEVYERHLSENTQCENLQDTATKILFFDGMGIVRALKKESWVYTCSDLARQFLEKVDSYFVSKTYNVVCMVFDPYTPGQLTKIRHGKDTEGSSL